MAEIVAERMFRDSSSGAGVTARIFAPERIAGTSEWSCKVEVRGLPMPLEQSLIGVDSFQALELGLRLLWSYLEKHEANLAFLDGPPGDCSLPLIAFCPPSLRAEMRKLIDDKVKDYFVSRG